VGDVSRLALESVTKRYGDVLALDDVSLTAAEGGVHCLLGPNGSGKTTMLRLLLGLEGPSSGEVRRDGVTLGCGFQDPSFYPSLSVGENLAVFADMLDAPPDWRERLVATLRLDPVLHRRADDVSGGYARKLDLALALLDRPDVLILDEPLGALDDASRERLLTFLADYCEAGNAVLVSTHQVETFEPVLDRVTVVLDGHVLFDGQPADLGDGGGRLQSRYLDLVAGRDPLADDIADGADRGEP
jgi:ABC-2 type transport system ATP-binding protein